jgi:hypothetical protein
MISTAACLLLATGVVLFSGPADEGEAIVRRYGRATKRYFPSDSVPPVDKIAIELDVEGQPADNGVYRDLVHLGWVRLPGASMAVLQPASRSSGSRAVFPTLKAKCTSSTSARRTLASGFCTGFGRRWGYRT